jgi:hypothetical protein
MNHPCAMSAVKRINASWAGTVLKQGLDKYSEDVWRRKASNSTDDARRRFHEEHDIAEVRHTVFIHYDCLQSVNAIVQW